MNRIRRFGQNAGFVGAGLNLFVFALLLLGAQGAIKRGDYYLAPIILGGLFGPYLVRNVLVEHAQATQKLMNLAWFGLMAVVLVHLLRVVQLPVWAGPVIFGVLSLYVGVYFWLLSDWRIGRVR